jgi:cell division protein FtsZ
MIEFTPDGPFAEKPDPLFPDRVRVIGLGHTGVSACDQLVLRGQPLQDLWAFDSDQQTIEASIVPNRYLLGRNLVHGLGANGDIELAREIVALEENRLSHVAHGCDFLILILGLAGSTGLALAEYLTEEARKSGARVIVVGVQPFAFEGWSRHEKAVKAIEELRREADSVLVLSHDRLTEEDSTVKNVRHGFHLMHQIMAQTTQALAQIVCKRGLVQLSFADVRSLYGRYAGTETLENCWVAHVEGDIHDRTEELIQRLMEGPLVGDESIWKSVDHAVVTISGTRSLGLSDVQEIVGVLKDRLPSNLPLAASACTDDAENEKLRITLLLARTAPVPATSGKEIPAPKSIPVESPPARPAAGKSAAVPEPVAAAPKKTAAKKPRPTPAAKPKPIPLRVEEILPPEEEQAEEISEAAPGAPTRFIAKQEEMQFEGPPRGRFEKTHETIHNGENLDLPTFRRRRLEIRL